MRKCFPIVCIMFKFTFQLIIVFIVVLLKLRYNLFIFIYNFDKICSSMQPATHEPGQGPG